MATSVQGRVELIDPSPSDSSASGPAFRATNARGKSILLGSAPTDEAAAKDWTGVSPMEVVLLGLGGCTGLDVISTLRKMRQDVTGYAVRVRGERRDEHPRIYTRIEVEHELRGRALKEDSVRRAITLSAGKYCSVSAMLEVNAELTLTYRIVEDTTGAHTTGSIPRAHIEALTEGE